MMTSLTLPTWNENDTQEVIEDKIKSYELHLKHLSQIQKLKAGVGYSQMNSNNQPLPSKVEQTNQPSKQIPTSQAPISSQATVSSSIAHSTTSSFSSSPLLSPLTSSLSSTSASLSSFSPLPTSNVHSNFASKSTTTTITTTIPIPQLPPTPSPSILFKSAVDTLPFHVPLSDCRQKYCWDDSLLEILHRSNYDPISALSLLQGLVNNMLANGGSSTSTLSGYYNMKRWSQDALQVFFQKIKFPAGPDTCNVHEIYEGLISFQQKSPPEIYTTKDIISLYLVLFSSDVTSKEPVTQRMLRGTVVHSILHYF